MPSSYAAPRWASRPRLLALTALALIATVSASAQPVSIETVASGLTSPFGIAAGPDGNFYVVEQGTGADDAQISIVTPTGAVSPFLVGLQSVVSPEGETAGTWNLAFDGTDLWIVEGVGGTGLGSHLLRVSTAGFTPGDPALTRADLDVEQDISAFVMGEGFLDTNLYNLTFGPGGDLFLVDAGANAVLRRDAATGALSVFATFPSISNPTTVGGPFIEPVPTSIVYTGSGFLVSALTGFPFVPGLSRVYSVDLSGNVTLLQDGLTSLTDIALDPGDGHPVVLTFSEFLLAPPPGGGFQPGTGGLTALYDGTPVPLVGGLNFTPAFTFGPSDDLYVTSLFGLVLRIEVGNLPPAPVDIADGDIIDVEVGSGSTTVNFSFISPESGQTTTIALHEAADVDPTASYFPGDFTFSQTPGNPATASASFSVSSSISNDTGDYDFIITATDDGSPAESTEIRVTVRVSYPPTLACDFGVSFYINEFMAQPTDNYFQIYSTEPGPVDLSGCSFVALDAMSEQIVVSQQLNFLQYPFVEPERRSGLDFTGLIPSGPGAIAIVKGTPALGSGVGAVLGDVVNAIVYYNDGGGDYDGDSIFGICGEGTLIGGTVPAAPCNSSEGSDALVEALNRLGNAIAEEAGGALDLSVVAAPNPVAGTGSVSFGLAEAGDVTVALYDALGRQVAVLAEGPHGAGRHEAAFDASALPAGVYVVRAVAGGETRTARLTIVR